MALIIGFAVASTTRSEARPLATAKPLDGEIQVQRSGNLAATTISRLSPLYGGDLTMTGTDSKAVLLFNEGSQLRLNSNTVIEVAAPGTGDKNRPTLFRLLKGEVYVEAHSRLAVATRSATAAVRGTAFNLQVDDAGVTTLTVVKGSVDFFNDLGTVVVNASQQSVAKPGESPTAPTAVAALAPITQWTQGVGYTFYAAPPPSLAGPLHGASDSVDTPEFPGSSEFGPSFSSSFMYQNKVRTKSKPDGALGLAAGFGNRQKVGFDVGLNILSLASGLGGREGFGRRGSFNFGLRHQWADDAGIAIGVQNTLIWGHSDAPTQTYAVVSKMLQLKNNTQAPFSRLYLSAGVGHLSWGSNSVRQISGTKIKSSYALGSVAVNVASSANAFAQWTGESLDVGLTIVPSRSEKFVITPKLADVAGYSPNGTRFTLGIGYRF